MHETLKSSSPQPPNNEAAMDNKEAERKLPYEVVDLSDEESVRALSFLQELNTAKNDDGSQKYVLHGAHMTGFHEEYGLPQVHWHPTLDPSASRQEHPAIYATFAVEGALTHAILKHRPEDAGKNHGQTFALNLDGGGKEILMSPQLQEAARNGTLEFTDGYMYVLPAEEFEPGWQGGDHEVTSDHEVTPALGIKVGPSLGPELMKHMKIVSFIEDES